MGKSGALPNILPRRCVGHGNTCPTYKLAARPDSAAGNDLPGRHRDQGNRRDPAQGEGKAEDQAFERHFEVTHHGELSVRGMSGDDGRWLGEASRTALVPDGFRAARRGKTLQTEESPLLSLSEVSILRVALDVHTKTWGTGSAVVVRIGHWLAGLVPLRAANPRHDVLPGQVPRHEARPRPSGGFPDIGRSPKNAQPARDFPELNRRQPARAKPAQPCSHERRA